MKESFLHFLWQYGLFDQSGLHTTDGRKVEIAGRGSLNRNSGPDFSEAKVKIDGTLWAGHVEMHVQASDWYRHGHQFDPAYDNAVLHVVYQDDQTVYRRDGSVLPCLELKGRIPAGYISRWQSLEQALGAVPCNELNPASRSAAVLSMKHRVLAERLLEKSERAEALAAATVEDWEEVLYRHVARYLGHKVNTEAMDTLAATLPLRLLRRHAGDLHQLEALLFGQAGFLSGRGGDKYMKSLRKEYQYLQGKYGLRPMELPWWKFGRLRPSNFPTIRIAQLAALINRSEASFSALLGMYEMAALKQFLTATASSYWDKHYRFMLEGREQPRHIGHDTICGLVLNAVIPVMFAYGRHRGDVSISDKAFDLMEKLPPENNAVTRYWEQLGFAHSSAYDSQALLGLKRMYCDKRRCLECSIGQQLLRDEEKITLASAPA